MSKMKTLIAGLLLSFSLTLAATANDNFHSFKLESLALEPMSFDQYKGKVVLLVNTASFCGFTPQYEGLQALYDEYKDKGLVVVGVPANNFNEQEPGSNKEIAEFCEKTYQVKFPMTDKMEVVGAKRHALYTWLASKLGEKSAPRWNFHKYLIGKDGEPVAYFSSRERPQGTKITKAIKSALAK
ncbi:glutathione peroxidase [Temperatibacter marinus]|uniref:Glutathione peroxidase n=1 Tax=Temperatibacter marinus TaxID=1456591 RepID=A0AA52HAB3_9PROT|nr:glutathione peroxidase [Temperatibacter marinus]WND03442.1 glutathione peroxidase [Temperatibacter marinus]